MSAAIGFCAMYFQREMQVKPHFLLAITHHITTSANFVNPTTNIVRLVEVNQIHRRS